MEAIEASATLRFERISPQKTRLVADMIRGRNVQEAQKILRFTRRKSAQVLGKLLKSAIANAEDKNVEDAEILRIDRVWVSQGPVYRRQMPRARGRANILRRPTSHITIVVKEDIKAKEEAAARQAALEAKRAKKAAKKKAVGKKKESPEKKEEKKKASSKEAGAASEKKAKTAAKPKAKKSDSGKSSKKGGKKEE